MLTGAGGITSKRSLIVMFTVSGQVPCSGAERRSKVLDEVSTAILGGAAAENMKITGFIRCIFWLELSIVSPNIHNYKKVLCGRFRFTHKCPWYPNSYIAFRTFM